MIGVVVTGDDVGGCTRVIAGALAGVEVEMGQGNELVGVSVGGVCIGRFNDGMIGVVVTGDNVGGCTE